MRLIGFDNTLWKNARTVVLLMCLLLLSPAFGQSGGDYTLTRSTIDGGGGVSSGGAYILRGTIGQPDAAWSSGGQYELLGGFWPGGPLCFVDFYSFARFAEQWLYTGTGLAADLDEDEDVDFADLKQFVTEWLYNCPYDWQLK